MKISQRIFLLILAISSISTLTNFLLTRHQGKLLHSNSEYLLAQTVIQSLRRALVQDVIDGNKLRVSELLHSIIQNNNPIEFLYVTTDNHRIFAHSFTQGFPRYLLHQPKQYSNPNGVQLIHKYQLQQGLVYEYNEPLIEGLDFNLHIGINQTYITKILKKNTQTILLISFILMLLFLVIAFYWGKQITHPLTVLTKQIQRFAAGKSVDFTQQGRVDPEIRQLAIAFQTAAKERQQAISELQEREQNLSITLNSIGDAVITTDASGFVSRMNPIAETLTGWSFQEAKGKLLKSIFPIINASTREPIENPVEKVLATGETVYLSNHTTLIAKDGSEYQIADSAAPILNEQGHIFGMVLVFNDVTEQYRLREQTKITQQALYNKEKEQREILNSMVNAVISIDKDNTILSFNKAAEDLFGYNFREVQGKNISLIISESINNKENTNKVDTLFSVTETTAGLGKDVNAQHKNKTSFPVRIFISDLKADIDDKQQFIISCIDLTLIKQQEEQLRRSQKMDALGKLTGGIAHDYNNILGIIMGYAEQISFHINDTERIKKYIDNINHAAKRGSSLTKKLLSFSRHKQAERHVIDINKLLLEQQEMLSKTLTANIILNLELDNNLWPVELDSNDLEDSLINLAINAMHAMNSKGQLTIVTRNEQLNTVDAEHMDMKAGDYVTISITDSGTGMDATTKEKIFDPFYTTKGKLGTGLGLSQVYGFVERSHGKIKVYSEPGHGSRFVLYFPKSPHTITSKTTDQSINKINTQGSETILVVDDEQAMIDLACEIFNNQGYRVLTASDGQQALKLLETENVHLVISDVIMPKMDGYQLATIIQKRYPHIKIQMVSGFADERHKRMINNSLLHQNMLHKPYTAKILLQRIRILLDDKTIPSPSVKQSILILDDDEDVLQLYKINLERLGYTVLLATTGEQALRIYKDAINNSLVIDIVISDLSIPGSYSGRDIAYQIKKMSPAVKIIVASGNSEAEEMKNPLAFGFDVAMEKDFNRDKIKNLLDKLLSS
ncbi:MAG TPA: response regulator [Gammaproteobacteria bacterium]|nr:response regulator [Gammaproteobacteria bacterium]